MPFWELDRSPTRTLEAEHRFRGGHDANAALVGVPPPPEHYMTHLPKHPGCAACMNCKMQKTQRRDKMREREKRRRQTVDLTLPANKEDTDREASAPKKFGDSVTSDSIIVIKSTTTAPTAERTSFTVKDRGTGWIAGYPSMRRTTQYVLEAVNDCKGGATVSHWY